MFRSLAGTPVNDTLLSHMDSNNTTNACDTESVGEKVTTSDEGI